ncbi:MAG: hypothetical protein ACKPKT_05295 [Dolichospermum sp.]
MKAQSFQVRTLKHQIQACLRLIALHVKSAILRLIDLESQLEVAMNEQIKNVIIKVDHMIAAEKRGYVAKIEGNDRQFLKVSERTGYGYSKQVLTFEIKEDGIYEIQDANFGGKLRRDYIKIQDGEIIERFKSLESLLASEELLPELEGSPKQIDWAFNIRERFIAKCKKAGKEIPPRIYSETSAKIYIDNRDKFNRF